MAADLHRRSMLARDIMSKPVITARPSDDLETAARRMLDNRIGCLPVVDDETGKLVGVLTESDFQAEPGYAPFSMFEMPRLFHRYIDVEGMERIYAEARQTPVSKLMNKHPSTLTEEAPIEKVASLMLDRHFHHVPIVRDGRPVGVIARRDLLRAMTRN